MKKALWLQAHEGTLSEESGTADELTHYRHRRSLRARTSGQSQVEREYLTRVRQWLGLPENRWCRVHLLLLGRRVPATQCHHYQGRRGMLLLYEPFWIPVSWEGHRWISEHRERARKLNLLCALGKYNSPVRNP